MALQRCEKGSGVNAARLVQLARLGGGWWFEPRCAVVDGVPPKVLAFHQVLMGTR